MLLYYNCYYYINSYYQIIITVIDVIIITYFTILILLWHGISPPPSLPIRDKSNQNEIKASNQSAGVWQRQHPADNCHLNLGNLHEFRTLTEWFEEFSPGGDDQLTSGNVEEKRRESAGAPASKSRHRLLHICWNQFDPIVN